MKIRMRAAIAAAAAAVTIAAGGGAAALASSSPAPAATTNASFTWHPLRLLSGWQALSSKYYGTPSYAVGDGILYLRGILTAAKSNDPLVADLPAGARPAHFLWLSYFNFGSGGSSSDMEIEPGGGIFIYGRAIDPSLQAISFPLSS
jgi:hypothetical protein